MSIPSDTPLSPTPDNPTSASFNGKGRRSPHDRTRILQVNYRHTFGGSEKLAATIGTSLDPNRFESLFAAMKGDGEVGEILRSKGYSTVVFGRNEGFDPFAVWRVWRYLRRTPIDIIQTHHVGSLVYCAPPARMLGMKIVHTEHDIHSFQSHPNELKWIKRLSKFPSRYIVIDRIIADYLESEVRVPSEKIHVIRNGINLDEFHATPSRAPRTSDSPFTIGWISRLAPPKRPDLLVDAIALLADAHPHIRARIIGGGELEKGLADLVKTRGLSNRIEFLGPRDDIAHQLQELDCYVLCSEREGLPISLVEAMASEVPSIVSAVGGIPDFVIHEKNGLLMDDFRPETLAGLIRQILDHPERSREIARQGRLDAKEKYDLKNTIQQYMDVFDQVMAERT